MNIHLFPITVASSLVAALTFGPGPKPTTAPSIQLESRTPSMALIAPPPQSWEETMDALSINSEVFRINKLQQIERYARDAQGLSTRCESSRTYLQTRVQALREHVDYARAELQKLPSSQGDPEFLSAQAHFYRTMNGLHDAFIQLHDEVDGGEVRVVQK
jgi:hypothetical protein